MANLYVQRGGSGNKTYVLLHGLGCTSEVWTGLISVITRERAGKWIAPDMRGHGRSEWEKPYGLGQHAGDLVPLIEEEENIIIIGHSMGALVGLVLATGIYNIDIVSVLALGPKIDWTPEEQTRLTAFAKKPPRVFKTQAEAIERYLLVSGLKGLITPDEPSLSSAIIEVSNGLRLSADPKTVTVGGPIQGIFHTAIDSSTIRLACGEHDTISNISGLQELDPDAKSLKGLSHNAHVEDPLAIWSLAKDLEAKTD